MSAPDDGSDIVALAVAYGVSGFVDPHASKPEAKAPDRKGAAAGGAVPNAKTGADDSADVLAMIAAHGCPGFNQ